MSYPFPKGTDVKRVVLLVVLFSTYVIMIFPFTSYMRNKPFVEKLGYVPQAEVLKLISADQKQMIAASLVWKTLFYFGSLIEKAANKIFIPPDYPGMLKVVQSVVKLDPYNMDAYYFAQAILVWDVGQIRLANELLEYGMKYRTWDFYLPFFAGFNYSYFLKDFEKAAGYYRKAAELSGSELFMSLAGRFMYEAGRTDQAVAYLSVMEKDAKNEAIRKSFKIRLDALKEVKKIEEASERYIRDKRQKPASVDQLLKEGYLREAPVDPYGGSFFIDDKGKVRSTSGFAFGPRK